MMATHILQFGATPERIIKMHRASTRYQKHMPSSVVRDPLSNIVGYAHIQSSVTSTFAYRC